MIKSDQITNQNWNISSNSKKENVYWKYMLLK